MFATQANHDIKILTNGADTRDISWYTIKYAAKQAEKSYNVSALLARRLAYWKKNQVLNLMHQEQNHTLIVQCVNTLSKYFELSSQQIVSFKRNPNDTFHIQAINGQIHIKSQLSDYSHCGDQLENYNLLEFLLLSYEPKNCTDVSYTLNGIIPYQDDHPVYRDRYCILHRPEAEFIPDFLGGWLPRNDEPETYNYYCACVMMLLKPWRKLENLKVSFPTWQEAFDAFLSSSLQQIRNILDNFQHRYACAYSARQKQQVQVNEQYARAVTSSGTQGVDDEDESPIVMDPVLATGLDIDEDDMPTREVIHGKQAVPIAEELGLFKDPNHSWDVRGPSCSYADQNLLTHNKCWQNTLREMTRHIPEGLTPWSFHMPSSSTNSRSVNPQERLQDIFSCLNEEQQ
ncbi:hypothetical protein M422DRAFT_267035 [Sphaerobolus stellatus SS14]|uniref:Uncharacterized protein n=1 Tax=Sphaerobolus stellatus (strain SS14) TaxID=990650 RepID=A0A0C9UQK7_SPHS4|nr:hypothetical protein M422DRAFT_267035 [Sphaerobolus stellatus SS14]